MESSDLGKHSRTHSCLFLICNNIVSDVQPGHDAENTHSGSKPTAVRSCDIMMQLVQHKHVIWTPTTPPPPKKRIRTHERAYKSGWCSSRLHFLNECVLCTARELPIVPLEALWHHHPFAQGYSSWVAPPPLFFLISSCYIFLSRSVIQPKLSDFCSCHSRCLLRAQSTRKRSLWQFIYVFGETLC